MAAGGKPHQAVASVLVYRAISVWVQVPVGWEAGPSAGSADRLVTRSHAPTQSGRIARNGWMRSVAWPWGSAMHLRRINVEPQRKVPKSEGNPVIVRPRERLLSWDPLARSRP